MYDLIVIGAGPAGIFASIFASKRGLKVLILEKMEKIGKKLLLSGAGQCNLTHVGEYKDFLEKYGNNGKFLKRALYKYPAKHMKNFFDERGLKLISNEKGKYFPETYNSQDVLDVLIKDLKKIDLILSTKVERLEKTNAKEFACHTQNSVFYGKNILISTGGLSYPNTGSSGDGYKLAKDMGHNIVSTKAALSPCYVENYPYADLSGISFKEAQLTIYRNNKKIAFNKGDLLLTHKNLSAPLIIDASRYINKSDKLIINFLTKSKVEFEEELRKKIKINSNKLIKNLISDENISQRFLEKVFKLSKVNPNKKASELKKEDIKLLTKELCEKEFLVTSLGSYNNAMATAGGIDLSEINRNACESKLVKGLYFAGEVMDIDGDTGGFNIQAAYSTGALVAESIQEDKNG